MKKQQSGLTNQVTFLLALTCGRGRQYVLYSTNWHPNCSGLSSQYWFYWFCYYADPIRVCARLIFLVPLGDVVDRRKLIIRVAALSSLSLSAAFLHQVFSCLHSLLFIVVLYCRPNHYSLCSGHGGASEPW